MAASASGGRSALCPRVMQGLAEGSSQAVKSLRVNCCTSPVSGRHQTTNLGAGGSNPSERANKIRHLSQFCAGKSAQKTRWGRPWADFCVRTPMGASSTAVGSDSS
jgi:hypothetical protein